MGAGASTAGADLSSATDDELSALFAEMDLRQAGTLPVTDLVSQAKTYFDSLPTSQPETWIRSIITKFDDDRDGFLDQQQFVSAVAALRKC